VGPVCWAAPPKGWVNCGMGAAVDSRTCANTVFNQVSSVGNLALTVATLGSSSGATTAAKGANNARKLNKLRKQFKKLQELYKKNKAAIDKVKKAKKVGGKAYSTYKTGKNVNILAMNADSATPEDIARVSAEIAALLDPTGVASTVAAYTYPTCDKIKP
jgi:hypothetical protein